MAGYGTKKPGGDVALELTFPTMFARVYSAPYSFAPARMGTPIDVMRGEDFQSRYHEEKRMASHQSVRNGLQARNTADRLLMTGHQNYHVPPPLLRQRRFANPSFGNTGNESARRDGSVNAPFVLREEGLTGGVLRTAEGQGYIQRKRMERISQLNTIDALARGERVSTSAPITTREPTDITENLKVEFALIRQALLDDLTTGTFTRFTYDGAKRMFEILFRYVPRADIEEMEDILSFFDTAVPLTEAALDGENQDALPQGQNQFVMESLNLLLTRGREYIVGMNEGRYRSLPERLALSKALIRSLGFTSLFRATPREAVDAARRNPRAMNQRERQEDEDDDDNDGGGDPYPRGRAREDDEQDGGTRQPLAGVGFDENQEGFGEQAGRYYPDGGGGAELERARFFDPFGEAPTETTPETSMDERSIVLNILRLPPDADDEAIEQAIANNWGGREDDLRDEVQRRMESQRTQMGQSSAAAMGPPTSRLRPTAEEFVPSTSSLRRSDFNERTKTIDSALTFARELGMRPRTDNLGNLRRSIIRKLGQLGVSLVEG